MPDTIINIPRTTNPIAIPVSNLKILDPQGNNIALGATIAPTLLAVGSIDWWLAAKTNVLPKKFTSVGARVKYRCSGTATQGGNSYQFTDVIMYLKTGYHPITQMQSIFSTSKILL